MPSGSMMRFLGGLVLLTALSCTARPAAAQQAADFYAGKTVTFVVGYTTGASYDSQARILTRHMSRYMPGKAQLVIQNMPGAGSLTAANTLFNVSPKDGTVIGMFARGMFLEALVGSPGVRFDPLKFNWIGSHAREVSMVLSGAKTPFKTVAETDMLEAAKHSLKPGRDGVVTLDFTAFEIKTLFLQEVFARGLFTLGTHNMSYAHGDEEVSALVEVYAEVFPILAEAVRERDVASRLRCAPLQPLFKVR